MSQTWTANCYVISNNGQADLAIFETNFATLRSMFSGAGEPASPEIGQPWFDTTDNIMKIRNADDDGWLGIMYGTSATKIWIFENVARNGWAIDSGVTDRVCALKGGAGSYNANGGTTAGSWTQTGHSLTEAEMPAHTHGSAGSHTHNVPIESQSGSAATIKRVTPGYRYAQSGRILSDGAHTHGNTGLSGDAHTHADTFRPLASVGTLQYPDV